MIQMQGACKRPRRRIKKYAAQGSAVGNAADELFSAVYFLPYTLAGSKALSFSS